MNLKLRQPSLAKMAPDQLPTPPLELMEYAEKGDAHLANGLADYLSMKKAALSLGHDVSCASRALDFGCANGRVTRWFENTGQREVWGCDIQAAKIFWALENLSPPLKFFVNSKEAHLPFPDRYFGFISAMSIFTHLNANHVSWLLELCRVLSPGGCLYITLHDRDTLDPSKAPRAQVLLDNHFKGIQNVAPDLNSIGFLSMNPYGNEGLSQVYMSRLHLQRILPDYMKIVGAVNRAYSDLQTAYVIQSTP